MAGYELALGPERQIRNVASVQQMNVVEGAGEARVSTLYGCAVPRR